MKSGKSGMIYCRTDLRCCLRGRRSAGRWWVKYCVVRSKSWAVPLPRHCALYYLAAWQRDKTLHSTQEWSQVCWNLIAWIMIEIPKILYA